MDNLNNLKDKLVIGLKDDINKFIYYGGDFGSHLNYFNNIIKITNERKPDPSNKCACGHDIVNNAYVKHKNTNEISVVGSCCINKFMTKDQKSRKCVFCNKNHKNNKNSICNECRKIYCNFCNKLCNKKICDICDMYHNNKKKCKRCNTLFKDEKLDYCKECKKKCYYHNEYHIDNINHDFCRYCGECYYDNIKHKNCSLCQKCYKNKCEDCKNIINFGKYKGTKFDELKDAKYLKWCFITYKEGTDIIGLKDLVEYYDSKFEKSKLN